MKILHIGLVLAGAMSAAVLPGAPGEARNIKAKPTPEACKEARARGQTLEGCPKPDPILDAPSGSGPGKPPEGQTDSAGDDQPTRGPRDGFLICPGNPRCPK